MKKDSQRIAQMKWAAVLLNMPDLWKVKLAVGALEGSYYNERKLLLLLHPRGTGRHCLCLRPSWDQMAARTTTVDISCT